MIVNGNAVMLTGAAEANSKVTVFDGGALLGTATTDSSGAWSYTTSPLSGGPHSFTATATDTAGNTSLVSQIYDPIVGGTTIEANGATSLIQVGTQYYLDDSTGTASALAEISGSQLCGRSIRRLDAHWRGKDRDRLRDRLKVWERRPIYALDHGQQRQLHHQYPAAGSGSGIASGPRPVSDRTSIVMARLVRVLERQWRAMVRPA